MNATKRKWLRMCVQSIPDHFSPPTQPGYEASQCTHNYYIEASSVTSLVSFFPQSIKGWIKHVGNI